jgi:hypothetical protein
MEEEPHSFIIRIWESTSDQAKQTKKTWRGSIDYVGSGKRLYFNDFDSIATFIREQVYADGLQAVERWEALVERTRLGRRFRSAWRLLTHHWLKRSQHSNQPAPGERKPQ